MNGLSAKEIASESGGSLFTGIGAAWDPLGFGKDSAGALGFGIVMLRNSSPSAREDQ